MASLLLEIPIPLNSGAGTITAPRPTPNARFILTLFPKFRSAIMSEEMANRLWLLPQYNSSRIACNPISEPQISLRRSLATASRAMAVRLARKAQQARLNISPNAGDFNREGKGKRLFGKAFARLPAHRGIQFVSRRIRRNLVVFGRKSLFDKSDRQGVEGIINNNESHEKFIMEKSWQAFGRCDGLAQGGRARVQASCRLDS